MSGSLSTTSGACRCPVYKNVGSVQCNRMEVGENKEVASLLVVSLEMLETPVSFLTRTMDKVSKRKLKTMMGHFNLESMDSIVSYKCHTCNGGQWK